MLTFAMFMSACGAVIVMPVTSTHNDLQQFHWSQGSAECYDGGSILAWPSTPDQP